MTTVTRAAPRTELVSPVSTVALLAVGGYVGAQLIADVTSLKIGNVAGRAVDMGTFIYPITFTLRDVVHKALGKRATRVLIFTAAAAAGLNSDTSTSAVPCRSETSCE